MGTHFQVASNFYLDLDGQAAERIHSMSLQADVQTALSTSGFAHKTINNFNSSKIEMTLGAGISRTMRRWIEDTLNKKHSRRNGSINVVNAANNQAVRSLNFYDALISEISLPALDAASKGDAYMSIAVAIERLSMAAASGTMDAKSRAKYTAQPFDKRHFKLSISGLEKECEKATSVSALTFKVGIKNTQVGENRFPEIEPTNIDESGLTIGLPQSYSAGFLEWADATVNGNSIATKTGTLEYFAIGSRKSTFAIEFTDLGIRSAALSKAATAVKTVKAELYYESAKLRAD